MTDGFILEMRNISKTYGGIQALKDVSLNLKAGEVLGLVGENGAGKSTLMKILCGIEKPDPESGAILLNGEEVKIGNPHHAQELGLAMIPQELLLVQEMTVMENVFLGRERVGRSPFLKKVEMTEVTRKILQDLQSSHIRPDAVVGTIPKADQQMVAIGRRMLQGGKIFVMDEPTAPLTEKETRNLFDVVCNRLCKQGLSAIFISHRLEEVIQICNRITVLRDGKLITTLEKEKGADKAALIYHMVGAEIKDEFPKIQVERGKEVLRVERLAFSTNQGGTVKDIGFTVHEGEVVGITGLVGVGKTELGQTLLGLRRPLGGKVFIDDREVAINSPIEAVGHGFGYVSEDRRGEGLILDLQCLYNMTISSLKKVARNFVINKNKERQIGTAIAKRLSMRNDFLDMEAQQLSGGNQQKVVVIRQIVNDARIVIFDESTKGIDVAAKSEISRIIGELSRERKAILLLSSEPREVLGISDVIFVLTREGLEGPFPRGVLDYEQLMAIEFGTGRAKTGGGAG
jgi:ribose transport system ATP-binding protein